MSQDSVAKLRRVRYMRWSGLPRCAWEPVENTLFAFVYDHYVHVGRLRRSGQCRRLLLKG